MVIPKNRLWIAMASLIVLATKLYDRDLVDMSSKRKIGKITIDRERCKGCHMCIEVCPTKNIEADRKRNKKGYHPAQYREGQKDYNREQKECTGCAQCATVCPEIAIEVYHGE